MIVRIQPGHSKGHESGVTAQKMELADLIYTLFIVKTGLEYVIVFTGCIELDLEHRLCFLVEL